MLDIRDFGGVPENDNAAALNAAVAECWVSGVREIFFPKGGWNFFTKPNDFTFGVRLVGVNPSESRLLRRYNGDFAVFTGAQGFGGGLSNIMIYAVGGFNGGRALMMKAGTNPTSCDYGWCENVVVTAEPGSMWNIPLFMDGSLRLNPQGVRDWHFKNIYLFGAQAAAMMLKNVVNVTFSGIGAYPAGGNTGDVYINGGSNTVHLTGNILGMLNLSGGSQRIVYSGVIGSLATESSVKDCHISGVCVGGADGNLVRSVVSLA